ncbi:MAG TPA: amidohydrolase family protein [Baekduia sp.]|nr:amidohydrolase family protein [Baekduia sp.]
MQPAAEPQTVDAPLLPGAIDIHAHYVTDGYRRALADAGISEPDGFPHVPAWDPAGAVAHMDALGIAAALLSVSSPGVHLGDDRAAARLARELNEAGAAAVAAHPGRFGLLASLPLPDVPGALAELRHAFDVLGADGVTLLTNVHGRYLSEPAYRPLWAELDERGALVVLHPASPGGWRATALGRPRPMLEFPLDTTRAVIDLILAGVTQRHRRVRFVVPHLGGGLAVLADRVHGFERAFAQAYGEPLDVIAELQRMFYDVAGAPLPRALPALLSLVGPERVLYGSDHPFSPQPAIAAVAGDLAATDALTDAGREAMLRGNALRLVPRLAEADR